MFKSLKVSLLAIVILCLGISPRLYAESECEIAHVWLEQALTDYAKYQTLERSIDLIERSIQVCPDNAYAFNNLGVLLEHRGDFEAAITAYRQAIALKSDFSEPWFGLGDVYAAQQQRPLSFEAYLQACVLGDEDAPKKVAALLRNKSYASIDPAQPLQKASLRVLFDGARLQQLQDLLKQCALPDGVQTRSISVEPTAVMHNMNFALSSSALSDLVRTQLALIARTLKSVGFNQLVVTGHTDEQGFKGLNTQQSKLKNQVLSEQRSLAVKMELLRQGISIDKIRAEGFGDSQPLKSERNEAAYRLNRRVEIGVM